MSRVRVILTDGDAQETAQLDAAINAYYPTVLRSRCGWHIVDRGWRRHCPGVKSVKKKHESQFLIIVSIIKTWKYSWMKGGCESEEEHRLSKLLLRNYLHSQKVLDVCGEVCLTRIREFVRDYIEPYEGNFCFHRRIGIRHFDVYTSSAHEGTNNGMKNCSAPVLPQHTLDKSASVLTWQAELSHNVSDR